MKRTISVLIILVMVLYSFTAMAFAVGPPMTGDLEDNGKEFTNWKASYTQEQLMAMRGRALKDRIRVHGNYLNFDVPPVIKQGRTLIPVRAITNGMGAEVEWNPTTSAITITRDDITIKFTLGEMSLWVWDGESPDPEEVVMDYPASLISNRTFVPLRFIAEALGDKVGYDKDTGDIDVLTKLATPDRPVLKNYLAEWDAVDEAKDYSLELFREGKNLKTVVVEDGDELSYNFESEMDADGCYTVRVTALATDDRSASKVSKPSFPQIVGECENISLIKGLIYALDDEDGMVEIETETTIEKVYVTKNTEIVIDGLAGDFDELDEGDAVVATLHDDDLIKLVVDND
jgi:hypothetical protein